jgi:6,7-dimethyl-8-ribityllumazine synthase
VRHIEISVTANCRCRLPTEFHRLSILATVLYTKHWHVCLFEVKSLQPKVHQGLLNAQGFRFALVVSRWNDFLTSKLTEGALDALERLGADENAVEIFKVPGSFELPLTAQKVALSGNFDAVICIGVVIRGETPHFDYVAGEAAKGVGQVSMQTGIPVLFSVVTTDTLEQAINRAGVKAGNKGFEAAMSAVELVNLYKEMDGGEKQPVKNQQAFPHVV